jgi:hypothetical protein
MDQGGGVKMYHRCVGSGPKETSKQNVDYDPYFRRRLCANLGNLKFLPFQNSLTWWQGVGCLFSPGRVGEDRESVQKKGAILMYL